MVPLLKLLVIRSAEPVRTKSFYELLGINFTAEQHGRGPSHFAGAVGDAILEIYPLRKDDVSAEHSLRLGFEIAAPEAVLKALTDAGTPVLSQASVTPWGKRVVVQDPDGRAVEVYSK